MQKLRACRNRGSETQRRRSTSSWCITAIGPAGPPKWVKPSFGQKANARRSLTCAGSYRGVPRVFTTRTQATVCSDNAQEGTEPRGFVGYHAYEMRRAGGEGVPVAQAPLEP